MGEGPRSWWADLLRRLGGTTAAGAAARTGAAPWCPAPAWPGDFPDPSVLAVPGSGYVAVATGSAGRNVQVLVSDDLASWQPRPDALPVLPRWAAPGATWSPVVVARPGGWALWVAVRHAASGRQAITVATADDPAGPYTDTSTDPVVFQLELGGSIDPSVVPDGEGGALLLWKADANALGRPSSLWAQPLGPDRTSLAGDPVRLLDHDAAWERPLIEAPSMARAPDGTWVLWYSGGWWGSAGYGVGWASAPHPLGPWTKQTTTGPWLASDPAVAGPGGQEPLVDHGGRRWLALHGWSPGRVGYPAGARTLRLVRVELGPGGRPEVVGP